MRPSAVLKVLSNVFSFHSSYTAFKKLFVHAAGRLDPAEASFIPDTEGPKVYRTARIWLALFGCVLLVCLATGSILPAMLIGLPTLCGGWLLLVFGLTQHAGLDEDVLDHRLNSRTVMLHPVFRFLYWNMNYHIEHHMFPMVPYHTLPKLHEAIKHGCPTAYAGLFAAYREILPTVWRQRKDPAFFVKRNLPDTARPFGVELAAAE